MMQALEINTNSSNDDSSNENENDSNHHGKNDNNHNTSNNHNHHNTAIRILAVKIVTLFMIIIVMTVGLIITTLDLQAPHCAVPVSGAGAGTARRRSALRCQRTRLRLFNNSFI